MWKSERGREMNTERFMEMMNLRRCGFSYEEIGKRMGCSRQYVHETIGKRFRGDLNDIKRVYLREYFRKTLMTLQTFTKAVMGRNYTKGEYERIKRFIAGADSCFKIDEFIRMSKLTGLSFEELAELDKGADL
jgi:hypothetical protein